MHPLSLRPLTVGVLIVVGGTLAALPFRRHRPAEKVASSATLSSDGPIGSNLTSVPLVADLPSRPLEAEPSRVETRRGDQRSVSFRRQRPMHAPLTYEDIAVPIDSSRAAHRQRPGTAPAELAERDATRAADAAPRNFRPKADLPPETDLQPLGLSDSPSAAGLAETGAGGARSVLVPTPSASSATEPPAPDRPRRSEASDHTESQATPEPPQSSGNESARVAEDAESRSASRGLADRPAHGHDASHRDAGGEDSARSSDDLREASAGTLASSKIQSSTRRPTVSDRAPKREQRTRHWIRQPR